MRTFPIVALESLADDAERVIAAVEAVQPDALLHHAVGRDHRPRCDRQRPDGLADAWRAAKRALDPAGIPIPAC